MSGHRRLQELIARNVHKKKEQQNIVSNWKSTSIEVAIEELNILGYQVSLYQVEDISRWTCSLLRIVDRQTRGFGRGSSGLEAMIAARDSLFAPRKVVSIPITIAKKKVTVNDL